ncbi:MAG: hypothetical protein P8X47_03570 [Ignavibacteriaceae bacterium]
MKINYLILVLLIFVLLSLSCNESSSTQYDNIPAGRRDYIWTVDTINTPYDAMGRMWGSSPSDIWTTSDGSWDESISHFNGNKWTSFGVTGIIVPWAVYGFAYNDVYVGAENGTIWNFNGNSWIKFAELTKDGHSDLHFENIWGESPDDIYAFGAYPDQTGAFNETVIAHFNNGSWSMLNTDNLIGYVEHYYKNSPDNKFYLRLTKIGAPQFFDSTIIYEYRNDKYYKLYSSKESKGLQADISLINNEVYFILGNQIARRVNNQFLTILNVDNPNFYQRIWGRNSKDIFLLMTDGLAHYNGNDVEYLFHFTLGDVKPWTQIFGATLFEQDSFFLVYEPTTHLNLIYHGTLK